MWYKRKKLLFSFLCLAILVPGFLLMGFTAKNNLAHQSMKEDSGTFLLTVFLKHDQSKTLGEIQQKLKETGFYEKFPPPGIEIESWKIVMGIGQVVVLKVPPERLREVNVSLEKSAWGSYKTEFYPTYDYLPVYKQTIDSLHHMKDSLSLNKGMRFQMNDSLNEMKDTITQH